MKTCAELKKFVKERLAEELPAALKAHLDECELCRQLYEGQLAVMRLIGFKVFEQPRSAIETRGVSNIMREVRLAEDEPSAREARWLWMINEPRYALAMLLVVFIGLNLMRSDDHRKSVSVIFPPDSVLEQKVPASMQLLNQVAIGRENVLYDYPELPENPTAPWLEPSRPESGTVPVRFVNSLESENP
jgi:predicted anti-sigma-YlaC factor YlaD